MSEKRKAVLALLGAGIAWSTGGVLVKAVQWNPMAITSVRSLIAAALMLVVIKRPKFQWSLALVGGAVTYAATVTLYIAAVKLTTAANAILLQYTAPVWIAFFGISFLKEKPRAINVACIAISLGGMLLFFRVTPDNQPDHQLMMQAMLGNVLAALSGVTIAWQMLFLRKQKDAAPLESVFLGNVLAGLICLPWVTKGPMPDATGWLMIVTLGLFQLGFAYILYCYGTKHVTAIEAILLSTLEPILNPIWVALLIGEIPSGWALVGGVLVLSAATGRGLFTALEGRRRRIVAVRH